MLLTIIVSILGGSIAASSYIAEKSESAKDLIDKLMPYQVWIGAVLLFFSIKNLFRFLNHFNTITLLFAVAQFVVGFLLAYGLLVEYIFSKSDESKAKGQNIRTKLAQYQIPAGIGLIALGVLRLLSII